VTLGATNTPVTLKRLPRQRSLAVRRSPRYPVGVHLVVVAAAGDFLDVDGALLGAPLHQVLGVLLGGTCRRPGGVGVALVRLAPRRARVVGPSARTEKTETPYGMSGESGEMSENDGMSGDGSGESGERNENEPFYS